MQPTVKDGFLSVRTKTDSGWMQPFAVAVLNVGDVRHRTFVVYPLYVRSTSVTGHSNFAAKG